MVAVVVRAPASGATCDAPGALDAPDVVEAEPVSAGEYFTADQPTWNSAAVVLAAHALGDDGPTAGLFRGEALPAGLSRDELLQAGVAIEDERSSNRTNRPND